MLKAPDRQASLLLGLPDTLCELTSREEIQRLLREQDTEVVSIWGGGASRGCVIEKAFRKGLVS